MAPALQRDFYRSFSWIAQGAMSSTQGARPECVAPSAGDCRSAVDREQSCRLQHRVINCLWVILRGRVTPPIPLPGSRGRLAEWLVVVCAAGNAGRLNDSPTANAANEDMGRIRLDTVARQRPLRDYRRSHQIHRRLRDQTDRYLLQPGPSRLDFVLKPDSCTATRRLPECLESTLNTNYGAAT